MEAQDAERRKIERNLHDGAQQQLIALTIQLGLLEESAGDPAAVRQITPAVKDGLRAALEDLRDLARGIYPPLLADQGLLPALQAQARKAALPVEIDADGVGRFPQDTEAAVYFCTLEALQNITKYAGASRATVGLSCSGGSLRFTVTDDGAGFDTASTRHGTGLQGMADRLAALGGGLQVRSRPGHGTTAERPAPRYRIRSGLKGRRVAGLVDGELRAVRQPDRGQQPPALVGDVPRHLGSLAPQLGERGVDVVAHQVELVTALTVGRVNGELGGRQGEDEPAAAGVHRWQAEHVREERTDLLGLRGEHDRMHPGDHGTSLLLRAWG